MLLFGRVTYQGMAAHWPSASGDIADLMNHIAKAVFSNTLEKAEWNNTRLLKGNAEREVAKLKEQPGRDLFVFGSATLCSGLMQHGMIDEFRLVLTPVILGAGNPLFKPSPDRLQVRLLDARPLKSGGVILRYRPDREQ